MEMEIGKWTTETRSGMAPWHKLLSNFWGKIGKLEQSRKIGNLVEKFS